MWKVAACAAISMALHAALLWEWEGRWDEPREARAGRQLVHVHLIRQPMKAPVDAVDPTAPPASNSVVNPSESVTARRSKSGAVHNDATVPKPLLPSLETRGAEQMLGADSSAAARDPRLATAPVDDRGDGGYVPRPQLTVPPVLLTDVTIDEPPGLTEIGGIRSGVLALYIDDTGRVRHIRTDDWLLPPEYEEAARNAFSKARYRPGEIDGRPVKSRVRVLVTFGVPAR